MLGKFRQLVIDYFKEKINNIKIKLHNSNQIFKEKVTDITLHAIEWIGSIRSLIVHTLLFTLSFSLCYFFDVDFVKILLIDTTLVSFEAIYLSIFIQMSVNSQLKKMKEIHENVEDIQENVEDIQENVEDIQENVEDIQENVEDIQENVEDIQDDVDVLQKEVEEIQKEVDEIQDEDDDEDDEILVRIESTLDLLIKEVMELKKQQVKKKI